MRKTFMLQSGRLSDLREVSAAICGSMYSGRFIEKTDPAAKEAATAWIGGFDHATALFIPEYIEITGSEAGEILWRSAANQPRQVYKFDFQSSFGTFHCDNHGEFGGVLKTPHSSVPGNFCEIFEFCGKVYAIDSLDHMGFGHTMIYEFDAQGDKALLYDSGYFKLLSLAALTKEENRILILVSGEEAVEPGKHRELVKCSYLFALTKDGFHELARFDHKFCYVYNMLVQNDHMILGMDKIIAVADLTTKEIRAYSPLTVPAEKDIENVLHNRSL